MTRPHVALVSEHASPLAVLGGADAGGQNVYVASLARALADIGWRVTVFTRRDDPRLADTVPMGPGVSVRHVTAGPPCEIPKDHLFPFMAAFSDGLRSAFTADRPDIVHGHFWMSGWAALRAGRPLRLPVVETFHALGVVKRRHQGAEDTSPAEREATERMLLRNATHIIATCSDEVRELAALDSRSPARVTVVPCGVDPGFTRHGPLDSEPRRQPHRLVSVSRLVPRKGVDDAIRALAQISDAELVVAGGPPQEEVRIDPAVAQLHEVARHCGVGARVVFRGRLGREEVAALLRSSDVAVCTPWYEPFGIVPLEAMACGVPVVGSAVGGLLDSVVHDGTGVLVPPRDPRAIAGAVSTLLADESRRIRMGASAARRVARLFSWDGVARQTAQVYDGILRVAPQYAGSAELA
jgi:glycosyltransferase involved in cell wall biosynthesis